MKKVYMLAMATFVVTVMASGAGSFTGAGFSVPDGLFSIAARGEDCTGDQNRDQDRLKDQDKLKDGSCQDAGLTVFQAKQVLAKNSKSGDCDGDQDKDRVRDQLKDGSCKNGVTIVQETVLAANANPPGDCDQVKDQVKDQAKDATCLSS